MTTQYLSDIDYILSKRHDNGADFWATPDKRLIKGSPFTTLDSAYMLVELGMDPSDPILQGTADLIFSTWRKDGRFRLTPTGAIYPCQTINAVRTLCYLGLVTDPRIRKSMDHLMSIRHTDGGWRCNKFSYGRGPETEFSNPGPTLAALDAFRLTGTAQSSTELDTAVEFLLSHWDTRTPLGPCHYGIGTLFMQTSFPFMSYNIFFYLYVLSFYEKAKTDERFIEALKQFESKITDGNVIVERPNPKHANLIFCRKGKVSELATRRYHEILDKRIIYRSISDDPVQISDKEGCM